MRKILITIFCLAALNVFAENVLFKYVGPDDPAAIVTENVKVIKIGDNTYLSGERAVIESLFDNSSIEQIKPPKRELKSIRNLSGWINLTTQAGDSQMDYIYRTLSLPSTMESHDSTSLRICLEGSAGDSASVDAVRVSASDKPDAFAYEWGSSMATPFVTAAAALGYSYFGSFSKQDLLNNSENVNTSKGDIKKLNLYQYLTSTSPVGVSRYVPDDEFFDLQWGLDATNDSDIDWPEGINYFENQDNNTAAPIVVLMDSGIAWNHPDLQDNLLNGGDFGNYGFNFCPDENIDNTYDNIGHGTHIAGVMGAVTDNSFGMAGIVNNNVKILNMKITCEDSFGINFTAELSAVQKILELKYQGYNVKFVNMSFGGGTFVSDEKSALQSLVDEGIHIFAAAGNDSSSARDYPAGYDNVTAVGSLNEAGDVSSFSNYGDWVDIYAPGSSIFSTYNQYLAKPGSLNLMNNYKDAFRNEFDFIADDTSFSGGWHLDGSGHAEISLSNTGLCGDNINNSIIMGPFDPDLPEYRYKNIIASLKASTGATLNFAWYDNTTATNNSSDSTTPTDNTTTDNSDNTTNPVSTSSGGGGGGCSIAGNTENNNILFMLVVISAVFGIRRIISAKRRRC